MQTTTSQTQDTSSVSQETTWNVSVSQGTTWNVYDFEENLIYSKLSDTEVKEFFLIHDPALYLLELVH